MRLRRRTRSVCRRSGRGAATRPWPAWLRPCGAGRAGPFRRRPGRCCGHVAPVPRRRRASTHCCGLRTPSVSPPCNGRCARRERRFATRGRGRGRGRSALAGPRSRAPSWHGPSARWPRGWPRRLRRRPRRPPSGASRRGSGAGSLPDPPGASAAGSSAAPSAGGGGTGLKGTAAEGGGAGASCGAGGAGTGAGRGVGAGAAAARGAGNSAPGGGTAGSGGAGGGYGGPVGAGPSGGTTGGTGGTSQGGAGTGSANLLRCSCWRNGAWRPVPELLRPAALALLPPVWAAALVALGPRQRPCRPPPAVGARPPAVRRAGAAGPGALWPLVGAPRRAAGGGVRHRCLGQRGRGRPDPRAGLHARGHRRQAPSGRGRGAGLRAARRCRSPRRPAPRL